MKFKKYLLPDKKNNKAKNKNQILQFQELLII